MTLYQMRKEIKRLRLEIETLRDIRELDKAKTKEIEKKYTDLKDYKNIELVKSMATLADANAHLAMYAAKISVPQTF